MADQSTNNDLNSSTIVVSNADELLSALKNSQGGETIALAGGDYGEVLISKISFDSSVKLIAQDDTNPPVFSTLTIADSANIDLVGFDVKFVPDAESVAWDSAVRIIHSSGISIVDFEIEGGPSVNGVPQETEAGGLDATGNVLGLPVGRAITMTDCTDMEISGTDISNFHNGIVLTGVDGVDITDNEIHDLRSSPLRGGDVDNVTVTGNYFHDFHPWNFGGAGDHGDFIHFWTRPDQEGASQNFVITDNFFAQGEGESLLGIYLDDNRQNIGFENVQIENNVLYNGNFQGVRLENVSYATIDSNTLLPSSGDEFDAPTILVLDGSHDVVVSNNIVSQPMSIDPAKEGLSAVSVTNNAQVQAIDPNGDMYVGDLFVDALAGSGATLADFMVLPHTALDASGAGADLSHFGLSGSPTVAVETGDGLQSLQHLFSIDVIGTMGEVVDLAKATVTWDFGDGTTAKGLTIPHGYEHAGNYKVVAHVVTENGFAFSVNKTIVVSSTIALLADFDVTARDLSDTENAVTVGGKVTFEDHDGGKAVRLNGDTVSFARSDEFLNNSEFTLMVDFKKDVGQENAGGRLINLSSSFVVFVDADGIRAALTTDKGTSWIKTTKLGLQDSVWHKMALSFSGEKGTATLYLDGQEIGSISGLEGATQVGSPHQDLHLGNPFGDGGFGGLIDNLSFVRTALTPEQINMGLEATMKEAALSAYDAWDLPEPNTPNDPANTYVEKEKIVDAVHDFSFEGDLGEVHTATAVNPLRTHEGANGQAALVLNGETIKFGTTQQHFHNHEYTVVLDFKKADAGEDGRILNFNGSFMVGLKGDMLYAQITTDQGRDAIWARGVDILNDDWHSLALRFSGKDGTATLYLDGVAVGSVSGLDGAVQTGNKNQPIYIGNPWGDGFSGEVDNFGFVQRAMSTNEIAARADTRPTDTTSSDFYVDNFFATGIADTFDFATGAGTDRIRDFDVTRDRIDLSEMSAITDWQDLTTHHLRQVGDDAVIDAGNGDVLIVANTMLADLGQHDFLF